MHVIFISMRIYCHLQGGYDMKVQKDTRALLGQLYRALLRMVKYCFLCFVFLACTAGYLATMAAAIQTPMQKIALGLFAWAILILLIIGKRSHHSMLAFIDQERKD